MQNAKKQDAKSGVEILTIKDLMENILVGFGMAMRSETDAACGIFHTKGQRLQRYNDRDGNSCMPLFLRYRSFVA